MTTIELLADHCQRNLDLLIMTLGDFSDADMLARACPGANNAIWQLGHLISSEVFMVNANKPGAALELPAGFADKFSHDTTGSDDPKAFPTKAELLELLGKVRGATLRWVRSLKAEDLNQPGPERLRAIAPTVGHLVLFLSTHLTMHLGQIQVIRRKLDKPVLF